MLFSGFSSPLSYVRFSRAFITFGRHSGVRITIRRRWRRRSRCARGSAGACDQPVQNVSKPAKVADEEIVVVWISNDRPQHSLVDLQKQNVTRSYIVYKCVNLLLSNEILVEKIRNR